MVARQLRNTGINQRHCTFFNKQTMILKIYFLRILKVCLNKTHCTSTIARQLENIDSEQTVHRNKFGRV